MLFDPDIYMILVCLLQGSPLFLYQGHSDCALGGIIQCCGKDDHTRTHMYLEQFLKSNLAY